MHQLTAAGPSAGVTDAEIARRPAVSPTAARADRLLGVAVLVGAALVGGGRLVVTGWPFDRLWAEDGAVFLADALDHGWRSVGYSYAGYMHGLPRVLTLLGTLLPVADAASYAALVSLVVTAVLALSVFTDARHVLGSRWWALPAALTTVTAPALGVESLGSLANLQWFVLYAALWSALRRPGTTRWWPGALLAFVAAATTPLTVALVPVLLLHRRGALRHPVTAGIGAGLVLQVLSRGLAPRSEGRVLDRHPAVPEGLARSYLEGVAGMPATTARDAAVFGTLLLAAGVLAFACARRRRLPAVVVALVGAALFAGTSVMTAIVTPRYIALGTLYLWAALLLVASAARSWAAAPVAILLATAAVIGFPAQPYLVSGPSWSTEVDRAAAGCAAPERPDHVPVPLSPADWGTMNLRCSSLQ